MFESCFTPVDIVHRMRTRYGFPVELAGCRPSVVCGFRVGAIDLPAELGHRVYRLLRSLRSLPIIADSRDTTWTFLVDASRPVSPLGARQRRLAERGVVLRRRGQRVLLPVADAGPGWRWASEPTPGALRLPPRTTVLDAADLAIDLTTASTGTYPSVSDPSVRRVCFSTRGQLAMQDRRCEGRRGCRC